MVIEKGRKHLPPYVSYRTFHNFMQQLQQNIPARIDRSYWGDLLSGSNGTQLMAALRFLNLIDANGKPMEYLKVLAGGRGEQRTKSLNLILNESYGFVFNGTLDLQSATYSQLEEVFHNTFQLTDDVCRKCVKFFIAMANDAGRTVSPHITKRTRTSHGTSGIKVMPKKAVNRTPKNGQIPLPEDKIPDFSFWHTKLLDKFPNFDPAWSEELKLKWFTGYDELMRMGKEHQR
jgi:hypothetical protein